LKILILKPSSLGDVIQALPVLRLLKRRFPTAEIYWWVDASLAPLLHGDPDLAGIIPFKRRGWDRPQNWRQLWRDVRWARSQNFDWVIDLQSLARSGAFAWIARGQFTIGLEDTREGAPGFYDRSVPRASFHTHAVDWYLDVLRALDVPVHWNFEWLPARPAVLWRIRTEWPVVDSSFIALLPGARWENKRWPADNFSELIRQIAATHSDCRFVILGSGADRELGAVIAGSHPDCCLDLTGKTSLPEMIELIRLSKVTVANDTGPMHVAAALRRPVVAVFGPTEPRRTGPYGQLGGVLQTNLPCVPCMKARCTWPQPLECLHQITPALVRARIDPWLLTEAIMESV
jgi:heptosyltransferase I